MFLTTHELVLVEHALELALNEGHNVIAACPDVHRYADDIADIRRDLDAFAGLLDRVRIFTGAADLDDETPGE